MQYILDFDRTLFDTEHFKRTVFSDEPSQQIVRTSVWDTYNAAEFLYSDTIPFLSSCERADVCILTAVSPALGADAFAFQKAKVEQSGVLAYVRDVVYMEGDKGTYVAHLSEHIPSVFVDDHAVHLLSAQQCAPEVALAQMIRPKLQTDIARVSDSSIPVISSLQQLPELFCM